MRTFLAGLTDHYWLDQGRNRTLCLDTGCVFGGALTALRYPEDETVSEPAREVYCESLRPFIR